MGEDRTDLESAYALDGPESAKALYKRWAQTYDSGFSEGWGYVAPREVARIYHENMTDQDQPILDIGAGTGLIAEHLRGLTVDALDITPEMLEVASEKGLYRNLIEADLLQPLDLGTDTYGGVISAGTFTHGHVGPSCFEELFRVTKPGALFVCGCIPAVYDQEGFGSTLAVAVADGLIDPIDFRVIAIYEGADHPHAGDQGLVMAFRTR